MTANEKLANAAGSTAATAKGLTADLTGVLKPLVAGHAEISTLIESLRLGGDAVESRKEHFPTLRTKLITLFQAAGATVYPEFKKHRGLVDAVERSAQRREDVLQRLERVDKTSFDSPQWLDRLTDLKNAFSEHVDAEENTLFPAAAERVGEGDLRGLEPQFIAKRELISESVEQGKTYKASPKIVAV